MTFEILQKSPEVAPLLVRLYDMHNLYALAESTDSGDACHELTTIMVDLLNIQLSDRESELIADVLIALMKQAETDLKAALSDRLSGMDNVPLRMILSLANDEISIAEPVLRRSPILQDLDLIYILQAKGVGHGRVIATRSGLGTDVIDMLAATKDFEIAVNLSVNDGVKLTQNAFRIFTEMAIERHALARPLLSRADVPEGVAHKLYDYVSEELKKSLIARFASQGEQAADIVYDIVLELRKPDISKYDEIDTLMAFARNQSRRGELKMPMMIATLRRGQYSTFIAQLAAFCDLPFNTVKAMIRQESAKGLTMACKAMGVSKADFVSLYLLTDRFRTTVKRMVNHKELARIMCMYDDVDVEDARRILKNSRN